MPFGVSNSAQQMDSAAIEPYSWLVMSIGKFRIISCQIERKNNNQVFQFCDRQKLNQPIRMIPKTFISTGIPFCFAKRHSKNECLHFKLNFIILNILLDTLFSPNYKHFASSMVSGSFFENVSGLNSTATTAIMADPPNSMPDTKPCCAFCRDRKWKIRLSSKHQIFPPCGDYYL